MHKNLPLPKARAPATPMETLQLLGKILEQEQAKKYRKLIEANNNNNHS